jgi:hypothetical protein
MGAAFCQRAVFRLLAARGCAYAIKVGYWHWLPLKQLAAERERWLPVAPNVTGFFHDLHIPQWNLHLRVMIYRTHVDHSVEILSNTAGLPPELPGLASLHHERFDGSGYPRGLRGDAIAISGLIAGIVDAYDTLTAPQPFGENLSPAKALSIIYKGRGTQFHPALTEQFIQCIGIYPVGSVVELNSGEVAIVIAQNMVRRLQPRIMVVKDAKGDMLIPYKMLDLMKEPKVRPDEPYRILRSLEYDSVKIDPREMFL